MVIDNKNRSAVLPAARPQYTGEPPVLRLYPTVL